MAPQHHGLDVPHRHLQLHSDERAETGRVQDAGHADYLGGGQAAPGQRHAAHDIQRIGDHDQKDIRRMGQQLFGNTPDNGTVFLQ